MVDVTFDAQGNPQMSIPIERVMLVVKPASMRLGVLGLMAEVVAAGANPVKLGTLWLFCSTRKKMLKGLLFRPTGFIVITKQAADGRYQWPRVDDVPEKIRQLTPQEFQRLLDGYGIIPTIHPVKLPEEEEEQEE